jgi:predicted RNA-binding protein Jag
VQLENFVKAAFEVADPRVVDDEVLREVEAAVDEALERRRPVELPPQNHHLRRLQHQLIERFGLSSQSKGEEPYRRVIIIPN